VVWRSEKGKFLAVVEEIAEKFEKGQPILVGTISVEKSERLSAMLKDARHFLPRVELRVQGLLKAAEKQNGAEWDNLRKTLERPGSLRDQELEPFKHLIPSKGAIRQQWEWLSRAVHTLELIRKGIPHRVLNAKYHEQEAEIVAQAGRSNTVTISTNMAGRGTDIKLGGNAEYLAYNLMAKEGFDHRADWKVELFIQKLVQGNDAEAMQLASDLGVKPEVAEEIKRLRDACAADGIKVKEVGGLFILGTERHESRRIDNQLRGRAGRQGDPGGSRFMVSFDDDLMRLFASETVIGMLDRMGFDDSEPIENQMVTRSIERAQKRVEDRNFATRKQLLQFDDVMARQREVVYGQRRSVLLGPDEEVREGALNMIEDGMAAEVENALNPQVHPEDWDIPSLRATLVDLVPGLDSFDFEQLHKLKPEESADRVVAAVREQYAARETDLSPQIMRAVERFVTLQMVDNSWKEHLHNLDVLRQGIGLRGYGQRDPFQEYKIEGTKMFNGMIENIKTEVAKLLFRLKVEVEPTPVQTLQPVSMSHGGQPEAQASPDPFTVQRARPQNRPAPVAGLSRAERRKQEREEKKQKKK
jgi:preprotein translocase subunit SecA